MRRGALCAILLAVTPLPAQNTAQTRPALSIPDWMQSEKVGAALARLGADSAATTEEQIRITAIPAPPFQEAARGAYLARLLSDAGLAVKTDDVGNVIARRPGRRADSLVLIAAHLDTVFPAGTDVNARREGGRIFAPGISDNGAGLAALVTIARAMRDADIRTESTILFVADVGEEGEGNLRGMRKLVETYGDQLRYVIAVDGSASDYVSNAALASRRVEVTLSGPGGHSWSDFGAPNPIHALARGVARFVKMQVPDAPRTSFNVGSIEGGTSVNSIPARAAIKVDLRSESEAELGRLESALRRDIQAGLDEEMATSRRRGFSSAPALNLEFHVLGVRPGGELPDDSPLLAAVSAADHFLGNRSRFERSSTDANIPLAAGMHAIAIGAGGQSANAHSVGEWYDPAGRELGLRRVLLTLLGVAGVLSE
jgi:acetylornithine deacetylase/succinyl-diaminopimelate desuccinylase-like protein